MRFCNFSRFFHLAAIFAVFFYVSRSLAAPPPGVDEAEALPWFQADRATGDWWHGRTVLADQGVEMNASYTGQVWGNVLGGLDRSAAYMGLLQFGLDLDFEKLVGWKGGSFNMVWGWTSGDEMAAPVVGSNYAISGIEAPAGLRALDLWAQQTLFDEKLTLRLGMFAADQDFTLSEYSALFLNSCFGWPMRYEGPYTGAPAYPYSAPGFYAAVRPFAGFVWQSAVMQGDVYPRDANFYWHFDRKGGLLLINEAAYSWVNTRQPGTVKLGALFNTGYADLPDGSGEKAWGGAFYYGVLDQRLTTEPGSTTEAPQGLGGFLRAGFAAPQRSYPLGMLLQGGLTYTGLIPGRNRDTLGMACTWSQDSPQKAASLEGRNRGLEMIFEATYQIHLAPWCSVQPDLQYIVQPGGSTAIPNALLLGLSMAVNF